MSPTVEEQFEHAIQIYDIPWELVRIGSYYRTRVIHFSWLSAAKLQENKTLYLPLDWNDDQQEELTNKLSRYAETQRRLLIG